LRVFWGVGGRALGGVGGVRAGGLSFGFVLLGGERGGGLCLESGWGRGLLGGGAALAGGTHPEHEEAYGRERAGEVRRDVPEHAAHILSRTSMPSRSRPRRICRAVRAARASRLVRCSPSAFSTGSAS